MKLFLSHDYDVLWIPRAAARFQFLATNLLMGTMTDVFDPNDHRLYVPGMGMIPTSYYREDRGPGRILLYRYSRNVTIKLTVKSIFRSKIALHAKELAV
jgi:hypothetical protein